MTDRIRVLVTDDHSIVRKGIKALLATESGIEVVGEACDGVEAVEMAAKLKPDVILMDMMMPRMDGVEAIKQITGKPSAPRILVLTSFAADEKVFPAIKSGALGYLLKDSSPEELVDAIRKVHGGQASLHPMIARKLLDEMARGSSKPASPDPLTEREIEVVKLLAKGYSNRQIADDMVISEATVRTHVSNILSKLHLASRTEAALYALREGLATLDREGKD